jgi:alpha-galactosidase
MTVRLWTLVSIVPVWVLMTRLTTPQAVQANARFVFKYNPAQNRWDMSNGMVHAAFDIDGNGKFGLVQFDDMGNNVWSSPSLTASSPISIQFGSTTYDATTAFQLVDQYVENPNATTQRQVIVLQDLNRAVQLEIDLEMYTSQSVLRHRVTITNIGFGQQPIETLNLVPYAFAAPPDESYDIFGVTQWSVAPALNFSSGQTALADGAPVSFSSGSGGTHCAWMALKDNSSNNGVFEGWEFDGQVTASAEYSSAEGSIRTAAALAGIYHSVAAGQSLALPAAFIGLFNGNWDQAASGTQKFMEAVLANPMPSNFPYVGWDSYGYGTSINETILRSNVDAAAALGIELFTVDLGWAEQIGDWVADPVKFPSGLHALSDYVHSKGMKFGLHFALAEAMATAPVLQQNPDWTSSESYNYHGALSLCLSNLATRNWIIQQAIQMIDNYNVDWILQDGQNMVKKCTKTTHTHDPRDSNYSNAVDGINYVVSEIRRERPNVLWENCEDGGSMMTFNMVQNYVTSITNDASGALGSRQGVYGATYPFSPRFADRYMIENPDSTYDTRSYMFGGPWYFMNQLPSFTDAESALAQTEIAVYKQIRSRIATGTVYHVTSAPAGGRVDAIESLQSANGPAVAVVVGDGSAVASTDIPIQGLSSAQTYIVTFQTDQRILSMTGAQLARPGVTVNLPAAQSGEIVYVSATSQ